MSVSEFEQKVADRFRDLFHSSWARAVDCLVVTLISIWLYAACWAGRNDSWPLDDAPRPLTWWRAQLVQTGIHYPRWLASIADWHAPRDGGAVLLVLLIGAVGAATGIRRSGAPGFSIVALVALTLSTQWFGLGRTMKVYGVLVTILVVGAFGMAARCWFIDRQRKYIQFYGMQFSKTTIRDGLMSGPVGVLIDPIVWPIVLLSRAVCTLGVDFGRQSSPSAAQLLARELHELEGSATPLSDIPAAKAARILAIVQLTAGSSSTRQNVIDVLSHQPPEAQDNDSWVNSR